MSDSPLTTAALTAAAWENRYQEGTTRWDLGRPAPPFVTLLSSVALQPGRMAVLGAGRGHDALFFAERGFEVVGFDFAPSAIEAAQRSAAERELTAQFLQRDIFELETEFAGAFDYVLEHTCFCAIAPEQRSAYVKLVTALLKPKGELIGLFWAHDRPGGPPFGVSLAELQQRFEPQFDTVTTSLVTNSVEGRSGEEYLLHLRAKPKPGSSEPRVTIS